MNIADIVLVEVGKRQFLQMIETGITQILVDVHFDLSAEETRHKIEKTLGNDHHDIPKCKDHNRIQCMSSNEMVQGILVEQWIYRVDHGCQCCCDDHPYKYLLMFLQIRKNTWNTE